MRITFNTTTIADTGRNTPDGQPVSLQDISFNEESSVQVRRGIGRAFASPRSRGNILTTISFTVIRRHESRQSAELYILDHSRAVPRSGNCVFEMTQGAKRSLRRFENAVLSVAVAHYVGKTTTHSYTIVGSEMSVIQTT